MEQLLEDAQKLMKAFMEQKTAPTLRTIRVEDTETKAQRVEEAPALRELLQNEAKFTQLCKMALLDSGATHPLRPRTRRDAVENMDKVNVTLAGENRVTVQSRDDCGRRRLTGDRSFGNVGEAVGL